jgi:regulatory protein
LKDQEKQALVTSLRLLAATPKSRRLLEQKLEEKGYSRESIRRVADELEARGLLNDREFARGVFQSLLGRRRSGRRKIAFELERKGVPQSLIEEILEGYALEEEKEKAEELAREKWERWEKLERSKRRKKVYDLLVRRGFDFELSRRVTNEVARDAHP